MTPDLAARLADINRAFYEDHARDFSETRSPWGAELEWIIPWVPEGASVLDLGCGNGRAAALLAVQRFRGVYVGIDDSPALLDAAEQRDTSAIPPEAHFFRGDLLREDLNTVLARHDVCQSFDVILALAFLHHIPGAQLRGQVLQQTVSALTPTGRLLLSTWQFLDHERMRRKIVPWNVAGIDERFVDPGDALLAWRRGSQSYRYCHWIGEQELEGLARAAGLRVVCSTRAGGRERSLSLCAVLEKEHSDGGVQTAGRGIGD